jgi:iron(III) transport system substrate-binding protein
MSNTTRFGSTVFLLTLALLGAGHRTEAQDTPVALYEGSDRHERLVTGAKKERTLNFYTSVNRLQQDSPVLAAFTKKHGIEVKVWRAASEKVLQRVLTEAKAGRFDADVVTITASDLEALHREKWLQPVKSPLFAEVMPEAVPRHREWVGTYTLAFVQAYNTNAVKREELPKTYQDLLHPRWKGRLGIEAKDYDWFYAVVQGLGEKEGLALFKQLVAKNGVSVRDGHSLLANLVASGEVPLALTVYHYTPDQLKQKGAPIEWFAIEPIVASLAATGVSKKAPHPHAAMLFYDFLLSAEAQTMLAEMHYAPINKKVASPLKNIPVVFIDPAAMLDESDKWTKLYNDIVVKQSAKP